MKICDGLELGRGYFEHVEYLNGNLILNGWMVLSDRQFDNFLLFVNNEFVKEIEIKIREDVGSAFPFIQHARKSGFAIKHPIIALKYNSLVDICLIGVGDGKQLAKMGTCYSKQLINTIPNPGSRLMNRVVNHESDSMFESTAFHSFNDYWKQTCKYNNPSDIKTFLDWGCGCGRLISLFHNLAEIPEVYGCDIDAEAIDWCKGNIDYANFEVIPPLPPTEYPADFFDLVVGNSVFTHLKRDVQISWLNEMKRIISPGGYFLASVHGEFATYFAFPDSVDTILKNGIHDDILDGNLDGIAPCSYYRATFQAKEYTKKVFSQDFEIVDYVERGSSNYQDLVIMTKPS